MSMSGGATQSITVLTTPTVVLPSRPGRRSLGIHNRNGNNNVSMIVMDHKDLVRVLEYCLTKP